MLIVIIQSYINEEIVFHFGRTYCLCNACVAGKKCGVDTDVASDTFGSS